MQLTLRTLGRLALETRGEPVGGSGGHRRALAILAVLATAGQKGIARETLQTLFWPDSDSDRARGALRQYLYSLRRDADAPDLILGTVELRLNPDVVASDVDMFLRAVSERRYQDAAELYGGPFMNGVNFQGLDELERRLSNEREALAKKFRSAVESLAGECTSRGEFAAAVRWWEALTREDPYSSQIAAGYMRALAAAGEPERAIRHADLYRRLLRAELGSDVTPEITAIVAQLKQANGTPPSRTVDRRPADAAESVPMVTPGEAVPHSKSSETVSPKTHRRWHVPWAIPAMALFSIGVVALSHPKRGLEAVSTTRSNRLVVLPFENKTGDKSLDALGAMGADWITDGLSRSALIPVTDPGTAAQALAMLKKRKGSDGYTLAEITTATGATSVVSGSFYRRGDSLELHARVLDGKTERVLGAIKPVTVLATQANKGIGLLRAQVLSLIANVFDARLSQVIAYDAAPPAFDAYREFVAGVDVWSLEVTFEDDSIHSARAHFRRAYSLDTTFVTALVWALFTYDLSTNEGRRLLDSLALRRDRLTPLEAYSVDHFEAEVKSDARAALYAAEAASDLAPRSEWSWSAGQILYPMNRPRETLKYFSRLDPDNGWMNNGWEYYWYLTAQTKHMLGDLKGTHEWLSRARKKFPQSVQIAAAYGRSLAFNGQSDSVASIVREILQSSHAEKVFYAYSMLEDFRRHGRNREASLVYQELLPWYQARGRGATESDRREFGRVLFSLSMDDSAATQFKKLLSDFPKTTWRTNYTGQLAVLAAKHGDSTTANRLINSVSPKAQQWSGENSYWRARVAAQIGHRSDAVALLRRAFDEGYPQISLSHSTWYDFPTLQGYPPFEALVAADR
jgi:DNA-binding SARP family transcriptional activator/TolB-like protein